MRTTLYAAVAALALGIGSAFAGEGGREPSPYRAPAPSQQRAIVLDAGNMAYPSAELLSPLPPSQFATGQLLPAQGSMAPQQTANSLPPGNR